MDTEQIITNAIEDAGLVESTDTGTENTDASVESIDSPTDAAASPVDHNAEATASEPQADPLLQEFSTRRDNRIPYSRVQKIVAKAREEARAAAAAEAQAFQQRYAHYESPEFLGLMEQLQIASSNPEQFLGALAAADPRYADLLKRSRANEAPAPRQASAGIEPDVRLPDGSLGYSQEAFERLLDAKMQAREAALEQKFSQRIQPFEDIRRQEALTNQALTRVHATVTAAQKWPGFVEHQEEITAAVLADKTLSLDDAYRNVVFGKLSASREEQRKQFIAEMQTKPNASQAKPSGAAKPAPGNRTIEEIITQSIAGMQ
jgi:hypothetical protein